MFVPPITWGATDFQPRAIVVTIPNPGRETGRGLVFRGVGRANSAIGAAAGATLSLLNATSRQYSGTRQKLRQDSLRSHPSVKWTQHAIRSGLVTLPRRDRFVETFAKHMSADAKKLDEDEETGAKKYRYIKTGENHFGFAFTYAWLAAAETMLWRRCSTWMWA